MVLIDLQSVLGALGLVSSIAKPVPVVGPVLGGLIGTVGGVVNSTLPAVSGPLNGLLPGLVGAVNVAPDSNGSVRASGTSDNETTFDSASADTDPSYNAADQGGDPCAMSPYSPPSPVYLESFAPYDANQALIYRYRQQQSVNLGSWFVQEQWMVPSLFTCAAGNKQAELDIANGWGSVDNARQVLEKHWDTWITEDDFAYLASIGINTVRLPIGYWSLGPTYCQGTPFESVAAAYVNSWARVVRAINWAEKYGLGILVDLHGAPGSQNGQGHSGTSDGIQNLFDNPTNVQLTMNVLTYLVQQLVKVNNVVGIQILNEPNNVDGLPAFYSNAITKLRQVAPEAASFPFYIHDGFDLGRFADYISTRNDFVVIDHHSYFVFGDTNDQKRPAQDLVTSLQPAKGSLSEQLLGAAAEGRRNMVVDEWSCALSQAALEGSSDPVGARQKFCTGQMESYTNATAGWSFWSYKTESCDSDVNWCFKSAVGKSLPATFYSYPQAAVKHIADVMSTDPSAGSSDTTYLTFGIPVTGSDAQAEGYTPPTDADWAAAMGASAPQYAGITEALAHTEYDDPATDNQQQSSDIDESGDAASLPAPSSSASLLPSVSASSTSGLASAASATPSTTPLDLYPPPDAEPVAPEQIPFLAGSVMPSDMSAFNDPTISTATIPSSRMEMADVKRRHLGSLPQRAFLIASDLRRHRFAARHLRHNALAIQNVKRQAPTGQLGSNATPQQNAITRGYSDGWRAAKTFAAANGSRLGFSGQFISDALTALGSEVMSGDAGYYRTWFRLADGEVQVLKSKALDSQGPNLAAR